jgi:hypothetical protein
MILKIFFAEKFGENIVFFLKLLLVFFRNLIVYNIGFWEKHHFSPKIAKNEKNVIITSTPEGWKNILMFTMVSSLQLNLSTKF